MEYATIIDAVIAASAEIGIPVCNKKKKSADELPSAVIALPLTDPFSKLQADTAGVQKIDKADF